MEYDEMFTVLSMCFAPVGQDEWKQLIDGPVSYTHLLYNET